MAKKFTSAITGAAFLMATSAIGPGFLTQTAVFTNQFAASFGFVILISILLDIGAQLNIWSVLVVKGEEGQEVANDLLPEPWQSTGSFGCVGQTRIQYRKYCGSRAWTTGTHEYLSRRSSDQCCDCHDDIFTGNMVKWMDVFTKVLGSNDHTHALCMLYI
jgi:hypothetical protein